jgi:hypothetical protein
MSVTCTHFIMDLKCHVPCGKGCGVAVCSAPLLVAACGQEYEFSDTVLNVWSFSGQRFVETWRLGGFKVDHANVWFGGGGVAFLPGRPLLLLADLTGGGAVHVLDAVAQTRRGFVIPPGSICFPRAVAAGGPLVAVLSGTGDIVLFRECGDCAWQFYDHVHASYSVNNICFSCDNSSLIYHSGMSVRRLDVVTKRGVHIAEGDYLLDSMHEEESNKFVVATHFHGVRLQHVSAEGRLETSQHYYVPNANSAVMVPGFGLVARGTSYSRGFVYLFSTTDLLAMRSMSHVRFAWMTAVSRARARVF